MTPDMSPYVDRYVTVDLGGVDGFLSVEAHVQVDPAKWPDERIREGAAKHWKVPLANVGPVRARPAIDELEDGD